jgi:hypothetical protein
MDQNEIPMNEFLEFSNFHDDFWAAFWKEWNNMSQQIQGSCPPGYCKIYEKEELIWLDCQNKKDVECSIKKNETLIKNGIKNQNLDTAHYDVLDFRRQICIP